MLSGNFFIKNISGAGFSWRMAVDVVATTIQTPGALVGSVINSVLVTNTTRVLLTANGVANGVYVDNARALDLTVGASAAATVYYCAAENLAWCCVSGDLVGTDVLVFQVLSGYLSRLVDVSLSGLLVGDSLRWTGSAWSNSSASSTTLIVLNSGGNILDENFLGPQTQTAVETNAQFVIPTSRTLVAVSVKTTPVVSAALTVKIRVNGSDVGSFVINTGNSFVRQALGVSVSGGDLISVQVVFAADPEVTCAATIEL